MIETIPTWVLELSKFAGAAGIIFVIWYLTAKWSQTQFNQFSELMREERKEQLRAAEDERKAMRDEARIERDRQFQLIREERERDYAAQGKISEVLTMISAHMGAVHAEMRAQGKDINEIKQFIFRERTK
jgi:hypothetical protein